MSESDKYRLKARLICSSWAMTTGADGLRPADSISAALLVNLKSGIAQALAEASREATERAAQIVDAKVAEIYKEYVRGDGVKLYQIAEAIRKEAACEK